MTLHVSGLSETRSGQVILHPTSLSFAPGDRFGLVGSSGSGKSTLGHAVIDALRKQGHKVAHVPQSPDEALDPLRSLAFHWREAEIGLGLPLAAVIGIGCLPPLTFLAAPWLNARGAGAEECSNVSLLLWP